MALVSKKRKLEAGKYEYRGYRVEKNGAKWDYSFNDKPIDSSKTLTAACEAIDVIIGGGEVKEEVKKETKTATHKKKKIENGHYQYRGFEIIKKKSSLWFVYKGENLIKSFKTLTTSCNTIDQIEDEGLDIKPQPVKEEVKTGKQTDSKDNKKPSVRRIFVDDVCKEIASKIINKIEIGEPTSIVDGETNYSIRWNNFYGNIEDVTIHLKNIMRDHYLYYHIDIYHTKNLLFIQINNNIDSKYSIQNKNKTSFDVLKKEFIIESEKFIVPSIQKEINLTERAIKCKEICEQAKDFFDLGNPTSTSYNEYCYRYGWTNYKGDKKEDFKRLEILNNQIDQFFEIRLSIGLTVCDISVSKKFTQNS